MNNFGDSLRNWIKVLYMEVESTGLNMVMQQSGLNHPPE